MIYSCVYVIQLIYLLRIQVKGVYPYIDLMGYNTVSPAIASMMSFLRPVELYLEPVACFPD